MSIPNATYGFLPWLRKGISGKIKAQTRNERATLKIDVAFNGSALSTKDVPIVGPGDILGISESVFVRTEPGNQVFNYEANNLAFIEFYDEDFPWRFTPTNVTDAKLTPWLALLMLKDEEFILSAGDPKNLPSKIEILVPISDVLHPEGEHYAWAHVHVNNPVGNTGAWLMNNLQNSLPTNPDLAISRLLCSRKLEPNTAYTAFVVPAFDTGRLAGLDGTTDLSTTDSLKMAWNYAGGATNVKFPFYKKWRCGTGALGDFETLVRALKPTVLDPELGTRPMDVTESGMGLDGLQENDFVGMEGALAPASFEPVEPVNNASTDEYTVELKKILNLSDSMQQVAYTSSTAITNPYVSATTIQNDPVILPPMYGQWPADVTKIDSSSPLWLQELNLDPRYRAAAGIGAQVIRERQEDLMETAWKQIGEINAVNDKIAKARLAMEASMSIYAKHFIGAVGTDEEEFNKVIKTAGLSLKRIKVDNPAASGLLSANKAADLSKMTKAGIDSGFRKITRSRSYAVNKMDDATPTSVTKINKDLTTSMNSGTVSTAAPVNPPNGSKTVTTYVGSLPGTTAPIPYTAGGLISGMTTYGGSPAWSSIYLNQALEFKKSLQFLDKRDEIINPVPATINKVNFANKVKQELMPDEKISDRVKKLINMQVPSGIASYSMKPIMAYPIIDEPMYDDLIQKSYDYLMPNLNQVPDNIVTLLSTNTKFIESYMAGLNHEFSRELLWREYPTDQKGSYFRRFWDIKDTIDTGTADYLNDIKPMHLWSGALGENHTGRHSGSGGDRLVLLIRGDLLKKYPNTLIYAQKAVDYTGATPVPRELKDALDSGGDITSDVKFPIFSANLNPDIVLLGFDLNKDEALGLTPSSEPGKTNAGWYFVFRERPGQLRFGLDVPSEGSVSTWDDLTWAHMSSEGNVEDVKVINIAEATLNPGIDFLNEEDISLVGTISTVEWGADSATMAWILNQAPSIVSIHAEDMIG